MAQEASPATGLDALAEHVGKDGPPLSLLEQLILNLLHLIQHISALLKMLFQSKTGRIKRDSAAGSLHLREDAVHSLGAVASAI